MEPTGDLPGSGSSLADSLELLGRELLAQDGFADAARAFQKCLGIDPQRAGVHVELGNALRRLDRPEEAAQHYNEALELEPENADAHYSVGLMHALAEDFSQAQRSFELAVLHYEEGSPLAHFNLGVALANQDKLDEAARSVSRSLGLDPDYLPALQTLGAIHARRKDERAAISVYRAGLERYPGEPGLLFGLGRVWVTAGDRPQAEKTLAELEAVDADFAARLARQIAEMP